MPIARDHEHNPRSSQGNSEFISSSMDPDAAAAAMTRSQWARFQEFYAPIESEVLERAMQTDFTKEGDEAGQTARQASQASRGSLARSLSRSGASLSAEEQKAISRRQGSSLVKSVARAENTTRRGLKESRAGLLAGIVNIGRGVANTAQAGMSSVADMAAQRELNYQQGKTAASNANMAMAATAASLVIMAI